MSDKNNKTRLLGEIRDNWRGHPLLRTASTYIIAAWLILQVSEVVLPSFDAPTWVMRAIITALIICFPFVLLAVRFTQADHQISENVIKPLELSPDPEKIDLEPKEEAAEILRMDAAELHFPIELSERRQIATLACSVSGLRANKNDPELLLGVVNSISEEILEIVDRYEGVHLKSGRNKIAITFGHPIMHEDDTLRAAKAGKEILALLYAQDKDHDPTTVIIGRAGIHLDTIILDKDAAREDIIDLVGDSLAIAEWLQTQAPPDAIALSPTSSNRLAGLFELEDIAQVSHPQLGQGIHVSRLGRAIPGQLQEVTQQQKALVGRASEHQILMDHWLLVEAGESQFVLIQGEAGIGKSHLIYATLRELMTTDSSQLIILNCESYYRNSPLYPVISFLEERVFNSDYTLENTERLKRLRAFLASAGLESTSALALLARLLNVKTDDESLLIDGSSALIRERTLELLVELIRAIADNHPVIIVVEDVHWADPSTSQLIERMLAEPPEQKIFGLFTSRPEVDLSWSGHANIIVINLNKLPSLATEAFVREKLAGTRIPPSLIDTLVSVSEGVPLYIEELVRSLLEIGDDLSTADLEAIAVPPSLQVSLESRVAHLGPGKQLLQLCSVIGESFSYQLLRRVIQSDNEALLKTVLASLVEEGLLYQKGIGSEATFRFKHRLVMEAAYQSLLKKTRQQLHGAIGATIEDHFPELKEKTPGRLAQHFGIAGDHERAISYRISAARQAQSKFANEEALAHLRNGMQLLDSIESKQQKNRFELYIQSISGSVLLASRGYTNPETRNAFERALELSEFAEDTPDKFKQLVGLWMYYVIAGRYKLALEIGQQLIVVAQQKTEPPELLQAHYAIGYTQLYMGDLYGAHASFKHSISHIVDGYDYTQQTPSEDDSRVHLYSMVSVTQWLIGNPDASRQAHEQALKLAEESNQPYALVWCLFQITCLQHMRGEMTLVQQYADRVIALAKEKGFGFFIVLGQFFKSSTLDDPEERLQSMMANHDFTIQMGALAGVTYWETMILEELISQALYDQARGFLQEMLAISDDMGEHLFDGEIKRLSAKLDEASSEHCVTVDLVRLTSEAVQTSLTIGNAPFALKAAIELCRISANDKVSMSVLNKVLDSYTSEDTTPDYVLASEWLQAYNSPQKTASQKIT